MLQNLEIRNVTKTVRRKTLLRNVTLALKPGGVYGILDADGRGSAALFLLLAGLVRMETGSIQVGARRGKNLDEVGVHYGILTEKMALDPARTGFENLRFLADMGGMGLADNEIWELMKTFALSGGSARTVSAYSEDEAKRLKLAQAFMGEPDVLLLFEPLSGLEASSAELVCEHILKMRERYAIVLLASRTRENLSALCDAFYLLEDGCFVKED